MRLNLNKNFGSKIIIKKILCRFVYSLKHIIMETNSNLEQIEPLTDEQVNLKVEKSVKVFFKHALKFGGLFSLFFIGLALLYYILDVNLFSNWAFAFLSVLINIVIIAIAMVFGINSYRDKYLSGTINYGRCFFMGLTIGFIASIISGVFSLLFNNLFDPEYLARQMAEMMQSMTEKGVPEEQLAMIQEKMEANFKPAAQALGTLVNSIIFSGIVSLIVSAFIRKKDKALLD